MDKFDKIVAAGMKKHRAAYSEFKEPYSVSVFRSDQFDGWIVEFRIGPNSFPLKRDIRAEYEINKKEIK